VNIEQNLFLPITVNMGSGLSDTVNISPTRGDYEVYLANVMVHGGSAQSTLNVYDTNDIFSHAWTITGSSLYDDAFGSGRVNFDRIRSVNLYGSDSSSTYTVLNTESSFTTSIQTGAADDTVNVQRTTGTLDLDNRGGHDTATVGSTAPSLGGSLLNIQGPVNVLTSLGGDTHLIVDDAADTRGGTATLTGSQLTGLSAAISYGIRVSALDIHGGRSGNFVVAGTSPTTPVNLFMGTGNVRVNVRATSGPLNIQGSAGTDSVTIGSTAPSLGGSLANIQGPVNVANISGSTSLVVDDSGDLMAQTAILTDHSITGLAPAAITYSFAQPSSLSLYGGRGGNTFDILSTASNVPLTLSSNNFDTINIGNSGSALGILGNVTLVNPPSFDDIHVDDSADPAAQSVTLASRTIAGASYGTIGFAGLATIAYKYADTYAVSVATGSGGDHVNVQATAKPVTFFSGGNSTFEIGSTSHRLDTIQGPLTLNGQPGDTYDLNDQGTTSVVSYTLSASTLTRASATSIAPITFNPVGDTINLNAGGQTSAINVAGTVAGSVYAVHCSNSIINVGDTSNTLDGIQGIVSVVGGRGNTLNIYDQGSSDGQQYDVEAGSVVRSLPGGPFVGPTVMYDASVTHLSLFSNTVESILFIGSTQSTTTYDVYGGGGFDEFVLAGVSLGYLSADAIQGPVHLHDPGSPLIGLNDFETPTSHIYNVQANSLQRLNLSQQPDMGIVTWDISQPIELGLVTAYDLVTGPRQDQVNLLSEISNDLYNFQVGTGDTVTIGSRGSQLGGTLATIQGLVRIQAGGESPNVVVDSGDAVGQHPTFQNLIFGLDGDGNPIYLPGVSGQGLPTIYFELCAAASATFLGGSGNNTYSVMNMTDAPALTLNGGTGATNTLDYSGYTGDILVDLPLGAATGVDGGISHFANVTGSQGNSLIVGDANPNILIGGTGRNALIGGGGADTLDASPATGGNILIGGTTDFDTNLAALNAIFAEWTRTDLGFSDRVSDLLTGSNSTGLAPLNSVDGTLVLLNQTTVHADTSPDTLTGGFGRNWHFVDFDDVITNFNSDADIKTIVN
jgi:hypothetical protein